MKWCIEIGEGDLIPRGYGVGCYVVNRAVAYCYPLGINVVVAASLAAWVWLKQPRHLLAYLARKESR